MNTKNKNKFDSINSDGISTKMEYKKSTLSNINKKKLIFKDVRLE